MTVELIISGANVRHSKTATEDRSTKVLLWSVVFSPIDIDQLFDEVLLVGHSIVDQRFLQVHAVLDDDLVARDRSVFL